MAISKINPIILSLLESRGIREESEILEFLSNKPQKTYDPFLLLNLEAGVDFLLSAAAQKKKICIYGDYDADGVTSTCILFEVLSHLTDRLDYYIPSRFDEGYGLNKDALESLRNNGTDVVVTVDCGSTSFEEVEFAKSIGLSVIITDHHGITDRKPDCPVINPKQKECRYPFKDLAGCGVAFKLAQGIQKKANLPKSVINQVLDLVAVGTVGDIVPLTGENRTMVKYGLNFLRRGARPGLRCLIEAIKLKPEAIRSDQVAFGIVPHLNAAGRMAHAKTGVSLLLSKKSETISRCTEILIENNQQRKKIQQDAYHHCIERIQEGGCGTLFLMINTDRVHEGIAGIVAGKLKDRYERPAALLTPTGDGYLKGTSRSIPGIDLYRLLKEQEELFVRFGGHAGACGFTIREEDLQTLHYGLEESLQKRLDEDPDLFAVKQQADLTIEGADITLNFAKELECLAPFGKDNEKPVFLLQDAEISNVAFMGADETHARFRAQCKDGSFVPCVLFQKARECRHLLCGGQPVELMGSIDIQEWRGKESVQFLVSSIT